jgi:cytidine deaminase
MVNYEHLVLTAKAVLVNSYSPYSNFSVAAAVQMSDGSVFTGVNVENVSFGLTICAERAAIFRAITEGRREIQAIAVVSSAGGFCSPCGACRQVIYEFANSDTSVIFEDDNGKLLVKKLDELLPLAFGPNSLPYKF